MNTIISRCCSSALRRATYAKHISLKIPKNLVLSSTACFTTNNYLQSTPIKALQINNTSKLNFLTTSPISYTQTLKRNYCKELNTTQTNTIATTADVSPASWLALTDDSTEVAMESTLKTENIFPFRIIGHDNQLIEIEVDPKESIRAESGSMLYMTGNMELESSFGGIGSAFTRAMTGQNFAVVDFSNTSDTEKGTVAFTSNTPSKLIPLVLRDHGGEIICQKTAFICGSKEVELEMHFTQGFKTGFFGGEGFILQKVKGDGMVLLSAGGGVICRELAEGEELKVATGSLVAFENTVNFDVEMVKGVKNMAFAGEGLFLTKFTGPGRVWLQSLSFSRLVDSIANKIPSGGGMGLGGLGVGGGGSSAESGEAGADGADVADGADGDGVYNVTEETDNSSNFNEPEMIKEDIDDDTDDSSSRGGGFFSSLFGGGSDDSDGYDGYDS